jgi:hypothetical protein
MPRLDMSAAAAGAIPSAAHTSPDKTAARPAPNSDLNSAPRVNLNMKALALRGKRTRPKASAGRHNLRQCGARDIHLRLSDDKALRRGLPS